MLSSYFYDAPSPWDWKPTLFIILISSLLLEAIYNVFFHPLARVPGPLFCKISGIPSFYHACRGDRHIWLWQLFQIYGSKVRSQPDTVLFYDPKAYSDIYSMKANVQKAPFYTAWIRRKGGENTLNTVDVALHARRRKLLNQAFTEKSLRASASFIIKHVDRWNELLIDDGGGGLDWSPPKNLTNAADALVFDILGDLCFGRSFETKEPGENPLRAMPHHTVTYLRFTYPIARSPMLGFVLWLKPRGLDALFSMITPTGVLRYADFVKESVRIRYKAQLEQRKKHESEQRQDMFHFLSEAIDPDTGKPAYNEQELFGEANLLIIAGSDTTSIALSSFFFFITHYPRQYSKLVHEIRTVFVSAEDITPGPKLKGCTYLRACIDESLRMAPSAPSELSRQVRAGGTTINGQFFPAGITVGSPGWATSRNETVYGDATVFRPERWIPDEATGVTAADVAYQKANFHPFSEGPGKCLGQNLAMQELMLVIARTLHRLDVRQAPGSDLGGGRPDLGWGRRDVCQFQLQDAYVAVRNGPEVQFRRRQH